MAYQETTTEGWGSRLGKAFKGIITGFVLIGLATWLLWWNEGRTFKTAGAIGEAQLVTQDVLDVSKIDSSLEGKVIHAIAKADTQEILKDNIFGVQANAIRLQRDVEFYQWVEESHSETRKKFGGGEETVTTYTYKKEWVSNPVDSNSFHDPEYKNSNIVISSIKDEDTWASKVSFGAYELPDFLKHSISGAVAIAPEKEKVDIKAVAGILNVPQSYIYEYYGYGAFDAEKFIHVSGNIVYLGIEPGSPKIGDVRVSFKQTPPAEVSIIAQVIRDTFEPFTASNGYTFSRLEMGKAGIAKMFEDAKSENNIIAWILRIVGIFLAAAGIGAILKFLEVIADVVPFIGNIVGFGISIVSILLGLAWSLIVIAIAWLRFRPIIAGILIAVAVLLIFLVSRKGKKKEE